MEMTSQYHPRALGFYSQYRIRTALHILQYIYTIDLDLSTLKAWS